MHDENDFESLFDTSGSLSAEEVRQIAAEQTIRTLQALEQGTATVQRMVQVAREEMEKAHPGFLGRLNDPEICRRFIEEKPAMSAAILRAEAGQGTALLPELYHALCGEI